MARRGGWRRLGSRGRFRYVDSRGRPIRDEAALEPVQPARLLHAGESHHEREQRRARQVEVRQQRVHAPELEAGRDEELSATLEWSAAVAVRLINVGWFRVGDERYAKRFRTYGITTLRKGHVRVRGSRITFRFRGKHRALVRTALVDEELAEAVRTLLAAPGGRRLFRYCSADTGELCGLTGRKLNDYIEEYLGEEFTAKDFRTWGGTLLAAVALAERGVAETEVEAKRNVAAVMRTVGERLGNTAAVARASYVSPAVVEQYLDGRTIDDFRPRHLRVVGARDVELDVEEQSLLSLLRSHRIRRARKAA